MKTYDIKYPSRTVRVPLTKLKSPLRKECGDGLVLVTAEVKLADGSIFPALLEIDETSSGEHCGTAFILFDHAKKQIHFAWQGDDDLTRHLSRTKEQIFPYKYRIRSALLCEDIHTGDDGWSN